jgi:hypothetical protein
MQYTICQEVFFKQMDDSFLAYSGQSGETMMLHEYAFHILTSLSQPFSYNELLKMLGCLYEDSDIDLEAFLQNTLRQFVEQGFINVSESA